MLGTGILVLFLFLVQDWARRRSGLSHHAKLASDLRIAGHFLLVTATWSLCGIFGIVTYALQPEIMLARALQPTAAMLTSHVMAELTLGWLPEALNESSSGLHFTPNDVNLGALAVQGSQT